MEIPSIYTGHFFLSMLVRSDMLLALMYQRFSRISSIVYIFPENRDFSERCTLYRYIIALFGLFSCVSVGLVYFSSLHLYSGIWC